MLHIFNEFVEIVEISKLEMSSIKKSPLFNSKP